ncbi:unnamed protein product [Moneuplotes crassus]|uniref:Uncharacterized protein n=1 Tax=Euplotes crassus TaxID=5936 RepID=A0AAD1XVB6_EUPCR|nr:unnamed protein product [Moneuplotes crassus]
MDRSYRGNLKKIADERSKSRSGSRKKDSMDSVKIVLQKPREKYLEETKKFIENEKSPPKNSFSQELVNFHSDSLQKSKNAAKYLNPDLAGLPPKGDPLCSKCKKKVPVQTIKENPAIREEPPRFSCEKVVAQLQ